MKRGWATRRNESVDDAALMEELEPETSVVVCCDGSVGSLLSVVRLFASVG